MPSLIFKEKCTYAGIWVRNPISDTVIPIKLSNTNIQWNRLDEAVLLDISLPLVEVVFKFLQYRKAQNCKLRVDEIFRTQGSHHFLCT